MRNTNGTMTLADLQDRLPPRRRGQTPPPVRICCYCLGEYVQRPKQRPTRNWCSKPGCEQLAESLKRQRIRAQS